MSNQNIGIRLDADLMAEVNALAEQLGLTRTAIIVEGIRLRLGLPSVGSVEQRLADVEQRLGIVEQALGSSAQQSKAPPNSEAALPPSVPTAAAPTPPPKLPREDAQQVAPQLDTKAAYGLARARGYQGSQVQFHAWAKGNPAALVGVGLEAVEVHGNVGPVGFADLESPADPKQPRQNRQQGGSKPAQVSEHPAESPGLTVGAALVAAGAEISEAHAMGSNRDQRMVTRYGLKASEWLEGQGWRKEGRKWYAPGK